MHGPRHTRPGEEAKARVLIEWVGKHGVEGGIKKAWTISHTS